VVAKLTSTELKLAEDVYPEASLVISEQFVLFLSNSICLVRISSGSSNLKQSGG